MNAKQRRHPVSAGRSGGFSLVEVLISIIILSFGLLGMVGLQAAALQGNREAKLQSTAVFLATDLAEMMRGNKEVARTMTASVNRYLGDFATPLAASVPSNCLNTGETACSTQADVANSHMTDWLARVDSSLPGAHANICYDAAPYDAAGMPQWNCTPSPTATLVIKIGWTRRSTDRSSTAEQFDRGTVPAVIFPVTPGNSL